MKLAIFASLALVCSSVTAFSQGAVILKNFGSGSNGSISPSATVTELVGGARTSPSYLVQLYAGATEGSLVAVGSPIAALANGLFGSPNVIIPGFAIGASVVVQARVWEAAGGASYEAAAAAMFKVGTSAAVTIAALGDAASTTPGSVPTLVGITPFTVQVVPEPATLALAGIGGLGLLALRRKTA